MREIYGARRDALLDGLRRDFDGLLEPITSDAGLHISTFASSPEVDLDRIARRAREQGVRVELLKAYYLGDAARPGIGFGYGGVDEDGIRAGLAILRKVWTTK
jgi:GntR family transcriptional regulator/MocR family aminotransferase